MKKTFLSIAILASSLFAFAAANSPVQSATATPTEQTSSAKQAKDKKKDNNKGRKGPATEGRRAHEDRLFEGINLTENQKARLASLKEKKKADRAAAKKEGKVRGENLTPDQREQMKAEKATGRRTFLAEIKEILTPEQYVTFLENSFSLNRDSHKMHRAHKSGHKKQNSDNRKDDRKRDASAKKGSKTDSRRS